MVVCSSCEVATFKVDLKVDNKMHTNNIVAQRCLQCWLSQLTLPIHGFKNIDSRTSSQLWYWLNMWWCSWLLLMSLTVFLCPVFVLTSQQNTVPLPLFYFLCFSFGSFAVVSVPLPLFRLFCHCFGSFAMRKSFVWQSDFPMVEAGLQRNGVTERKRANAANQPRIQLCSVHVHVIRGNWRIIVKRICFLSSLIVMEQHDNLKVSKKTWKIFI